MKVKQGDTVKVVAGKDKGKVGEVLRTLSKKNKIVVKGVNIVTKHIKKRLGNPGEKITKEAPIDASNVLVKCPSSNNFTRVNYKIADNGKKVRYSRKHDEYLDTAAKSSK